MKRPTRSTHPTSWEPVADWYKNYMGKEGGGFQRDIIFPGALRLMQPKAIGHYLDIACGQGAFANLVHQKTRAHVTGFDASPTLIADAKKFINKNLDFIVSDATDFHHRFQPTSFYGATCLLAIQNIDPLEPVIRNTAEVLKSNGSFVIVLNHPCFRQPSQSGWGWDEQRKLQYRRVDRYLSEFKAPILAHPGSDRSIKTFSYHRPLHVYLNLLAKHGFVIDALEEWASNKKSDSGPRAKAENIAREEIPMFLAIRALKTKSTTPLK